MATWIDWKGKLPTGYQAARRTRENRSQIFGDNLHVISEKRTDEETRGTDKVWRTLCGVEVEDTVDEENWRTECELSAYDLPPFPDDMKVCRICNARKRKLPTGGE
jgi:hypothetical protein